MRQSSHCALWIPEHYYTSGLMYGGDNHWWQSLGRTWI